MSPEHRPDGVRSWYDRTTKRARRALAFSSVVTLVGAILLYLLAPHSLHLNLQVFNGAYVIPVAGGIWIAAFMFIWLIPMRELSFRSQESLERTEARVEDAIENRIIPAVETWKRVGDPAESEIEAGLVEEMRAAVKEFRALAKSADDRLRVLERDVRPAIREFRDALVEVRAYMVPQRPSEENFQAALQTIKRSRPANGANGKDVVHDGRRS